jgi:hypothetical protein
MTIEQLCLQIDRRLAEARDEISRLEAARDTLRQGANTAATPGPGTRRTPPPQIRHRARRAPRGTVRQAVLSALAGGQAMTAGELAATTGLRRGTIAPELSKLVKIGALVKADRGYTAPPTETATPQAAPAIGRRGATRRTSAPAAAALARELDAGLRTRT